MPHLDGEPQHFYKSSEEKSIHRHKKDIAKKMHEPEQLNAWGQDDKTAKRVRKELRMEKKMKAFRKGASARFDAGY